MPPAVKGKNQVKSAVLSVDSFTFDSCLFRVSSFELRISGSQTVNQGTTVNIRAIGKAK